jgi:hypothetical protein
MSKRKNRSIARRGSDGIVKMTDAPILDDATIVQLMEDDESVKEFLSQPAKRKTEPRARLIAFMCTVYPLRKVASMFGVCYTTVFKDWSRYRDEVTKIIGGRNAMIATMAERRAIETLRSLKVENIPDDKKARTVKDLMDTGAIAGRYGEKKDDGRDEDTMELVFRVKRRIGRGVPADDGDGDDRDDGKVIDADFTEVKPKGEG